MTAEEREIAEIERMKAAIQNNRNTKLKNDYIKSIRRKQKQLRIYKLLRAEAEAKKGSK